MSQMYTVAVPTTRSSGVVKCAKVTNCPVFNLPSRTMELVEAVRTAINAAKNA